MDLDNVDLDDIPEEVEVPEVVEVSETEEKQPEVDPNTGVRKRIAKLAAKISEKDEIIQNLQAQLLTQKPNVVESPPQPTNKPKVDDFETHEEFVEALTDWKVDQALKKSEQTRLITEDKRQKEVKKSQWDDKVSAKREKYPDIDEILSEEVPVTHAMASVMMESEDGVELAVYLARNPKEATRISKLSSISAAKEMGKIEEKLNKPNTQGGIDKPKPPVPSKGGKSNGQKTIYDENISPEEYAKLRRSK